MARQTLKPPFEYYGGKATLAPQIAGILPDHDHYVEPFAGGLSVLLAKPMSRAETVNDLDGDLVTFWRVLRDQPEELERVCAMTPHSREEFALAQDRSGVDDLERARRVFVVLTQGREHSLKPASETNWRYTKGAKRESGSTPAQRIWSNHRRLASIAARLQVVSIENRDAVDVIRKYGSEPTVCIYADPPYLGSTRGGGYGVEMLDDGAHSELADALNECKASVVLSGYASPLYEELFDGWHRCELKAPNNQAGQKSQNEVLWSNVPIGDQNPLF